MTVGLILFTLLNLAWGRDTGGQELKIERAESFNHHVNYAAGNAHDGDYNSHYSVRDLHVAGNFLKLYLLQAYSMGEVKMTSRRGRGFVDRMLNTEVRVYSTEIGETEVAICGRITELNPEDADTLEGREFTLNCNGVVGDMLYLTDLDYTSDVGHNIAEVEIYGSVPPRSIEIVKSEAKSWYKDESDPDLVAPYKAYDGDYSTYYSVKDDDAVGNFLKLHLSGSFRIGVIKITNRLDGCCAQRIKDTAVKVYSGEKEAGNCGTITEYDQDNPKVQEAQSYTLNCDGVEGDMIYITDLTPGRLGHGISEVEVYESVLGEKGEEGEEGAVGEVGWPGLDGAKGENGINDFCSSDICTLKGDRGSPGVPGPPGAPGLPGRNGDNGRDGEIGLDGEEGESGEFGPEGLKGIKGSDGFNGSDGLDGEQTCNADKCDLKLGMCYGISRMRLTVQCKKGFAAASIWRNTRFWGLKCCKMVGSYKE